jgi:hypothetical protein
MMMMMMIVSPRTHSNTQKNKPKCLSEGTLQAIRTQLTNTGQRGEAQAPIHTFLI